MASLQYDEDVGRGHCFSPLFERQQADLNLRHPSQAAGTTKSAVRPRRDGLFFPVRVFVWSTSMMCFLFRVCVCVRACFCRSFAQRESSRHGVHRQGREGFPSDGGAHVPAVQAREGRRRQRRRRRRGHTPAREVAVLRRRHERELRCAGETIPSACWWTICDCWWLSSSSSSSSSWLSVPMRARLAVSTRTQAGSGVS